MNVEENRLKTFSNWPCNTIVCATKIAKAGFYYLKRDSIVECFACHVRLSDWNYSDQVMTRHRSVSPQCPFVVNPSTSGNVPMTTTSPANTPSSSSSSEFQSLLQEDVRLNTFENWPKSDIVSPERLARAGFYYMKQCDLTKCVYCHGLVRAWEREDDPDFEHKRLFPNCPFVRCVITPRIENNQVLQENTQQQHLNASTLPQLDLITNKELDELGVQTHTGPKRPDYGTVEARLRTFTSWPSELIQTPDILSQAGFYYVGINDLVRCFHCDGGLRHWDPHDDPWTEHAKYFPNCSFIKLIKGQDFVTACSTLERNGNNSSNLEEVAAKPLTTTQSTITTIRQREITDRELQEHMRSPAALAALGIGLNFERVKCAIKDKLEQTGRGYSTADALVEAALNLQRDEDDTPSTDPDTFLQTIVRNINQSDSEDKSPEGNPDQERSNQETHLTDTTKNDNLKLERGVSLEEENRILKEARLCKICMDNEVGIVFLPCGHLATCTNCAPNLATCPVCRQAIKATVRTFLS